MDNSFDKFPLSQLPLDVLNKQVIPRLPLKTQAAIVQANKYFWAGIVLYTRRKVDLLFDDSKNWVGVTESDIRKYTAVTSRMQQKTIDLTEIHIAQLDQYTQPFLAIAHAYGLKFLGIQQRSCYQNLQLQLSPLLLNNNVLQSLILLGGILLDVNDLCTGLAQNKHLTHLQLRGTLLSGDQIGKILAAITEAKTVTHVTFEGQSAGIDTLAALCDNTTLKVLYLDSCRIGDLAIDSILTFMRNNKKLEILSIAFPAFNQENKKKLQASSYQPKKYLSLRDFEY